ncbi:MAG: hypothetical protein U5R06_21190 [candidate division KSB1 bacterium]|nr:hypothetical protein [candidate division KSB1 bacterium]
MTLKRLFVFLMITGAIFWSCSDDSGNGTGPSSTEEPPELNVEFPTLPEKMQQSNDPHAQQVKTYLMIANNMSNTYLAYVIPPANAGNGDMNYTWTDGEVTVHLDISESGNTIEWKVRFSGSDGEHTYDNWLAMEAQRNKAGTQSSFVIYEKGIEGPAATFDYNKDDADTQSYDFKAYGSTGIRLLAAVNADSSGWAEQYEYMDNQFVLNEKYEWDAQGNGEWWNYNTDGSVSASGTW